MEDCMLAYIKFISKILLVETRKEMKETEGLTVPSPVHSVRKISR